MSKLSSVLSAIVLMMVVVPVIAKKQPPPSGVVAASAGDAVFVADPEGHWVSRFEAGTVGWLYPAPAGILFAPDLVSGRTTVVDLRSLRVAQRLDGVTMPHFGPDTDRYFVVAGDVMVVSYPDRAIMAQFSPDIGNPWQVIVVSNTAVFVLERQPNGSRGSTLVAIDPSSGQVVYRKRLGGDVQRIAVSPMLGLLALADASESVVRLVDPTTLATVLKLPVAAPALDVAFLKDGRSLVAAIAAPNAGGAVHLWRLKEGRRQLRIKREAEVRLSAAPVRLAVWPLGPRVAVGLESARIEIVDLDDQRLVGSVTLPETPRDVAWCDPSRPGPTLPEWSDEKPPELSLGASRDDPQ